MKLDMLSKEELNSIRINSEIDLYRMEDLLKQKLLETDIKNITEVLEDYRKALKFDNFIMNYYEERFREV